MYKWIFIDPYTHSSEQPTTQYYTVHQQCKASLIFQKFTEVKNNVKMTDGERLAHFKSV